MAVQHGQKYERAAGYGRLRSRKTAGILLVIFPTVIYGGISLLTFLIDRAAGYVDNPIRQDLFRAGHAHAGVFLVLSQNVLRYIDEARLTQGWKQFVRSSVPSAAILVPAGFFFSILSPSAVSPNRLIYLSFAGAVVLAAGLITLGVGLLRSQSET